LYYNDPTSRTPARDPEGRVATHRSEDPQRSVQRVPSKSTGTKKKGAVLKGHTPTTCKAQLSAHSTTRAHNTQLSLLLTTHGATTASATRPTPSSRDDEPLTKGRAYPEDLQSTTLSSLGYKSSQHSALTVADNTRRHNRLRNSFDTELPQRRAPN
ncbi:hypothetical protein Taro_017459, partial [Colocasia esculenta]|nr:hypothetical protein [Colocasia esculenta]